MQIVSGSGGIKSIQRGLASFSGVSSGTATISAVNTAKSILIFSNQTSGTAVADGFVRGVITNSTTLTFTRGSATGAINAEYQVIEYA